MLWALGGATKPGIGPLGLFFRQMEAQVGQQARAGLKGTEAEQSRIMELEGETGGSDSATGYFKKTLTILGQEPNNSTK